MIVTTTTASNIRLNSARTGGDVVKEDEDVTGDYIPIVDHLMKQKFLLHNQTRQHLVADVKRTAPLKPFTMFTNSKQGDKTFFSIGYSWDVCSDSYTVELCEYDNVTDVNLVEN
jgi:hypothetical protein